MTIVTGHNSDDDEISAARIDRGTFARTASSAALGRRLQRAPLHVAVLVFLFVTSSAAPEKKPAFDGTKAGTDLLSARDLIASSNLPAVTFALAGPLGRDAVVHLVRELQVSFQCG